MRKSYTLIGVLFLFLTIVFSGCMQKPTLKIYSWLDYIDPNIIEEFESTYQCKVTIDSYDSNEEMFENIENNETNFDIICPSGDHLQKLYQKGYLLELNQQLLPNYHHLDDSILKKNKSYDSNNVYGIPYFWGISGLIYNRDCIDSTDVTEFSWSMLGDPNFKDKITLIEAPREVIGVALLSLGIDPNDSSSENLTKAYEVVSNWRENGAMYYTLTDISEFPDGDNCLAMYYNGDANYLVRDFPNVGFSLCKEGSTFWIDSLVIPKNSKNVELAHQFINFICDPEIAARNAEYVRYASPNKSAYDSYISAEMKDNKTIYPSAEYLEKCYPIKNLGPETSKMDSLWNFLIGAEKK